MSISVHCDECGKTYQVPDDKAGRRGRCPKGHSIQVPVPESTAEVAEENAFAFTSGPTFIDRDDEPPAPKSARRRPARPAPAPEPEPEPEPAPAADDNDFSAFPTQLAGSSARDEDTPAPKTGRHRRPDRRAAGNEGKPSLMPLIMGGILAVVGVGAGVAMLVVSRGEVGPLREQAEAAERKAAAAEERAQKAESLKLLAEANLETAKKSPPKDPALAEAQKQLKAAEKRATDAEKKLKTLQAAGGGVAAMPAKELDPNAPGGKNDPVMPGGKLEADRPAKGRDLEKPPAKGNADAAGAPAGGKTWTAPETVTFGQLNFKAGDRLWLWPKEDAVLKAEGGKLIVRFRWQLRPGQNLPAKVGAALLIQEGGTIYTTVAPVTLTGANGDQEIAFDAKSFSGKLPVYFFLSDGQQRKPTIYSTILNLQADFGDEKK